MDHSWNWGSAIRRLCFFLEMIHSNAHQGWGGRWGVCVGKGVAIKKKEGVRLILGSFATQKECVLISRDEGLLGFSLEVVGRARGNQKEGVIVIFVCVCNK